jgi:hypothetical protein
MMAASFLVNARAAENPSFNPSPRKDTLKDSIKSLNNDFSRLLNYLTTAGGTDRLKPGLAQLIGLTGEPPVKGLDNSTPHADGREYHECSMVLPEDSASGTPSEGRPICLYFNKMVSSGPNVESHWYRVSMEGKLEKAVIHYNKLDENHEGIPGADSTVPEDIASPKVQKAFKAEMAFWLKDLDKKKREAATGKGASTAPPANTNTPAAAAAP